MDYKDILFEVESNIATITLNRPKALNALSSEMISEIGDAVSRCESDDEIRVVILTGAGDKAFAAGADISGFKNKSPREIIPFIEEGHNAFRRLELLGKATIAAINGYALGGGEEIAMCCDIRFCSDRAVFGQPEVLLGLIPGWGGTQRLARLVGMGRAKELIMSGENIKAQRAFEIGLVNRVFPAETLMEETRKFAGKLAGMPPFAIKMAKYAINHGYDMALDNARNLEIQCFSQCFSTSDLEEGLNAFQEKRKPQFTGK
ncbi:MAG: enoyl-CoA hydratase/isomerase family protein [Dehalococcoidia bacterium]|nr:enoyl-CoA hydratase/isomerase family protein [Dehalococcoidia bacterium]